MEYKKVLKISISADCGYMNLNDELYITDELLRVYGKTATL